MICVCNFIEMYTPLIYVHVFVPVCVWVSHVFYIVFTIRLMYFIHDWRINREHALSLIRLQSVLLVCSVYFFVQFFPLLNRQDCVYPCSQMSRFFFCNFIFLLSLNPSPLSTNKSCASFFFTSLNFLSSTNFPA